MKDLIGIEFNFPFTNLIKIADLINYDGPLLSHFVNSKGDNFLFYWVDVNENYNRWLLVRIDLYTLQNYLQKKITLHDIITNPNDGFVYSVDIDHNVNYINSKMVFVCNLFEEYIPSKDSFYEFEPQEEVDLFSLSLQQKSGLLELHISGQGIKYGSIPLDKYSVIIPKIEDIRKNLASKYISLYKNNKDLKLDRDAILSLYQETNYEYIYDLAGSFRIILRPTRSQLIVPGISSYADEFANEFVSLIGSGYNEEFLHDFSDKYNKTIIKKYSDFVNYISEEKLDFGLRWCNALSDSSSYKNIESKDTESILTNLSKFEYDETETIKTIGKFYSINTHSGSYSFESDEEENIISIGKFDKKLFNLVKFIYFAESYYVEIKREVKEQLGARPKRNDTIILFESLATQDHHINIELPQILQAVDEKKLIGDSMESARKMKFKAHELLSRISVFEKEKGSSISSEIDRFVYDFPYIQFHPKYKNDMEILKLTKEDAFISTSKSILNKIYKEESRLILINDIQKLQSNISSNSFSSYEYQASYRSILQLLIEYDSTPIIIYHIDFDKYNEEEATNCISYNLDLIKKHC